MGAYSELDAVNEMLISAGEHPVQTLGEEDSSSGTETALEILNSERRKVQSERAFCSTIRKIAIPNSEGKIPLPEETMEVVVVDRRDVDVCERDGFLYNLIDDTDDWSDFEGSAESSNSVNPTSTIPIPDGDSTSGIFTIEVVFGLTWDNLPTLQQQRIIAQASRKYANRQLGDPTIDNELREEHTYQRAVSRASEIRAKRRGLYRRNGPRRALQGVTRRDRLRDPWTN